MEIMIIRQELLGVNEKSPLIINSTIQDEDTIIEFGPPSDVEVNEDNQSVILANQNTHFFDLPTEIIVNNILSTLDYDPDLTNFSEVSKLANLMAKQTEVAKLAISMRDWQPSSLQACFVRSVLPTALVAGAAVLTFSAVFGGGLSFGLDTLVNGNSIFNFTPVFSQGQHDFIMYACLNSFISYASTAFNMGLYDFVVSEAWKIIGATSIVGSGLTLASYDFVKLLDDTKPIDAPMIAEISYDLVKAAAISGLGASLGVASKIAFRRFGLFAQDVRTDIEGRKNKLEEIKSYIRSFSQSNQASDMKLKNTI